MNNNVFYEGAIALVKEAREADEKGDYEKAYNGYKRGVQKFQAGLQLEKDPSTKKLMGEYAMQYMARLELLEKAIIDGKSGGGVASSSGGAATMAKPPGEASEKGGGGGDDAETSKLKGALASAIVSEKPNVKWDDVAGLEAAKEALKEAVILPARFPQLFTGNRKPWKGILLYGPPGTGKSYLAKAVATEANATFFSVSSSDLVSKWQGETERLMKNLFEMAREKKPAIIFIDEIDSIAGARGEGSESESARRMKTELLVQMQGVGKSVDGVLVLAATNTPWDIDAAVRRRFEKRIYIPLPEAPARASMFRLNLGTTPNNLSNDDFKKLGDSSAGMSGSDIGVVVREALMEPLRRCRMAQFFKRDPHTEMYAPCPLDADPACPRCPMNLTAAPAPKGLHCKPCEKCGYQRMTLYDLDGDNLQVPNVEMADFERVMKKATTSVATRELTKYQEWTEEFGSDGS